MSIMIEISNFEILIIFIILYQIDFTLYHIYILLKCHFEKIYSKFNSLLQIFCFTL